MNYGCVTLLLTRDEQKSTKQTTSLALIVGGALEGREGDGILSLTESGIG
jgi:hypothetical protein